MWGTWYRAGLVVTANKGPAATAIFFSAHMSKHIRPLKHFYPVV